MAGRLSALFPLYSSSLFEKEHGFVAVHMFHTAELQNIRTDRVSACGRLVFRHFALPGIIEADAGPS